MNRITLSDEEWLGILANLKKLTGIYVGQPDACRQFISASCGYYVWERSGGFCRQHRVSGIAYSSVFSRWCVNGAWEKFFGHFSEASDLQDVSMYGAVIRTHACVAGAANSTADNEAPRRSEGGFGCKIHALCDVRGHDFERRKNWFVEDGMNIEGL